MSRVTLVLGGARSGKSACAQDLASGLNEAVLYVAPAIAFDEDMRRRIDAHRASRPQTWRTLEAPSRLAAPLSENLGRETIVLIDCLTLWVSNVLMEDPAFPFDKGADSTALQERLIKESEAVLALARRNGLTLIAVSNEVGMGVVPPYASGHVFRDLLGRVNQCWASHADEVFLMVAGIPMVVKGPRI
ncbi:MAG: bifunctional adenosylcobinamide kinase/adenosylcobinamide-phosphate guanylyltransferase [Dehalococcoidia bacterium]|nr:bifunctional adenosylcobinamide kinase/adenosylcobinamide-phosphate guanylyltransferase [Dehalococcoidia bacterium]